MWFTLSSIAVVLLGLYALWSQWSKKWENYQAVNEVFGYSFSQFLREEWQLSTVTILFAVSIPGLWLGPSGETAEMENVDLGGEPLKQKITPVPTCNCESVHAKEDERSLDEFRKSWMTRSQDAGQ